jgi:hypothetical protein
MIECRATGFTPFRLLYGSKAMPPQELKHGSPRTNKSVVPDVDEPTSKDLIDGDRVFALQALDKYQVQTKAWRRLPSRATKSVQKSPKGAAGQAQQVHNTKSFSKDKPVQKSPKGASRQAQQVHDTKSFTKRQLRAKVA